MALTNDEVAYLGKLARIELTPLEIKEFSSQLSEVLGYMTVLNELDTNEVEETHQVTGLESVSREDIVESFDSKDLLGCSELEKENNQIKVKKII